MNLTIKFFGKVLSLVLTIIFFVFIYFITELKNEIYEAHIETTQIDQLFTFITVLVISGIVIFFISLFILKRKVLRPIEYLSDTITKFKNNDKNIQKVIFCDDEMGLFTEQFFDMKEKIEKDFHEMQKLATTDPLTKIYNRRAFFEASEKFFRLARRKALPLCVILIDIDHFKKVNDTYGHLVGDEILRLLAQLTSATLRDSDIYARYGGEEFIILLPDTDKDGAIKAAEKIRKVVEDTPYRDKTEVSITISCGVAQLSHDKLLKDLIRRADEALYRAKEYGRNRTEVDD